MPRGMRSLNDLSATAMDRGSSRAFHDIAIMPCEKTRSVSRKRRAIQCERKCNKRIPAVASIEGWRSDGRFSARARPQLVQGAMPGQNPEARAAKGYPR